MTRFEQLYGVALSPRKSRELLVLLLATETLLAFSYLGFIVVPPISLTTMHILVIVAALILGTRASLSVCTVFILTAVWKATVTAVQYNDLIFSPWRSGDPILSLVLDLSRLVFAAATGLLFAWYFQQKRADIWPGLIIGTVIATFLHAAAVYTAMALCFPATGVKMSLIWTHLFNVNNLLLYPLTVAVVAFIHLVLKRPTVKQFLTDISRVDRETVDKTHGIKRGLTAVAAVLALFVVAHLASRLDIAFSRLPGDTAIALETTSHQILLQSFAALLAVGVLLAVTLGWAGDYLAAKALTLQESRNEVERLKVKADTTRRLKEKNDLLSQQQSVLKAALARAESGNRAKAEFLANLSHEIRTPLNAVEGFTGLALGKLDENALARTDLMKARAAADELLNRVTSFVSMMRVDDNDVTVDQTKFSLFPLMGDACNFVTPLANAKGIRFSTAVPEKDVTVTGDRLRMTQILLNLLKNSVRYTPADGRISLTLAIIPEGDDRLTAQFTLTDNGIGMNKTYFTRLYEPFDRTEKDLADAADPQLDLNLTKQMVEFVGGTIDVMSSTRGHTEFVVRFPLTVASAATVAPSEPLTTPPEMPLAGRRVLIADDNALNLDVMRALAETLGLIVDTAPDGMKALALIDTHPAYAAVLLDIRMPQMDGCRAAREIRSRQDVKARVPLIAVSADTLDVWQKKAQDAGFDTVLEKPFTTADLKSAIAAVLKPASREEASSSEQC